MPLGKGLMIDERRAKLKRGAIFQKATVANYNNLLITENEKFDVGESSIFLVNSREIKFLDSQYKMAYIMSKLLNNRLVYI